jgi:hypothetical protein
MPARRTFYMALVCMALITGANGQNTEALSDMPPPCGSFTYDASMDYFPDKVLYHHCCNTVVTL